MAAPPPPPPNVEVEAAKFLQKLIHDSKDEPARLATKLFVILQHMKASGKENSLPYQVISRAMETVINQHGLDIEALTSSRLPSSSGPQGESATAHGAGTSQTLPVTESKSGMTGNDSARGGFGSCPPSAALNSAGQDLFQGSVSQRSGRSFDHESPSSIDTKSTNSHSQDRRETPGWEQQGAQKNPNRVSVKRKKSDSAATEPPDDNIQQLDSYNTVPDPKKERLTAKVEMPDKFSAVSESWKQGFKGAPNFPETSIPGSLLSSNHANVSMANNSASSSSAAGTQMGGDRFLQAANLSSVSEVGALRTPANRDTGRAPSTANMPFKEHHLKQLRAQCLVFLAFRNGLAPKRLHLEIALGNILLQEGTSGSVDGAQNELMPDKGKRPSTLESSGMVEASLPRAYPSHVKNERAVIGTAAAGCVLEANALNETRSVKTAGAEMGVLNEPLHMDSEKQVPPGTGLQVDKSNMISPSVHSHDGSLPSGTNQGDYVLGTNRPMRSDINRWTGVAQNDLSRGALPAFIPHELGIRKDGSSYGSQQEGDIQNLQHADSHLSTSWKAMQGDNGAVEKTTSIVDGSKIGPVFDSGYIHRSPSPLGSELEEEDKSGSAAVAPSSKQTLSERWIMAHQKRKVVNEQKWVRKLQKADQRIECRFNELKETVTSAEDISTKTKSVIELKKLQLLELQRRLRRNIMNDFFKPVQSEMDQLKSIKKHRIGRRMKHVEKYEQKMKEERQKRIRERQKEFFSEIEVHKERLEDVFKFKRERCKGFVRFVKEFHKRKERIHREKIDRIQREKINLLKINDVEGYLRMVQDAKSDRVKQLLKETEKYLQKLGSKLQEAKTSAREVDIDENRIATFDESSENAAETEDGNDQAKHYKESNEKYYLIAHSIKESITEQPAGIQGGKLREYQMNGLRWLVSLYNNHLNGILADEMGLGKTVQVISLLCYLMEAKNDRGPFLVVVPSSVLPGWERELSFWAPGINKIVYSGPPEERRRLFKDCIVHQKFNVLLTTYEYLMNKHDRPKLSKIHWHYVIIDEGHRIKNASCKLNAELKHYQSSHRLLLTGTPLQNSLEELWALLNFLLPNIFNSSEDFSQWFNKPFEGSGDTSSDEALLSEEENLLIINRLHQVLRPFVLRRLKHKVENELPEKIERLVRCEASAYQKLLMTRVEENLGSMGVSKGRAIHNTVMELRNICNHPYLSQLHVEEVDSLIPKHFLPPIIRLCGKLEMLDRLLPKLKETNHRVLFFSTMTRLLDIMEDYLVWKQYRYLRLDGHTSGQDRGALIEKFNQPDSPFFIFLLSIRAGGVGVNLQAADTVIIFDTDWNPQVDLQAQARAHRIGQKKDVLVLRLETVKSVEEQVRAAAEHKLGVANQSITAGFFDNNTSAEDRREYLESLLRESKKEEAAPVLDDDSLNDILARSEPEIAVFEEIDKRRREEEMATWKTLVMEHGGKVDEGLPALPSRLVTEDDLKAFYEAMKKHQAARDGGTSSSGVKRKGNYVGGFDSQHYGRGKRAREVRSYEEQWSEEEFEKMCQSEYPESFMFKDNKVNVPQQLEGQIATRVEIPLQSPQPLLPSLGSSSLRKEITPPVKRGRGRPRRIPTDVPPVGVTEPASQPQRVIAPTVTGHISLDSVGNSAAIEDATGGSHGVGEISLTSEAVQALPSAQTAQGSISVGTQPKRQGRRGRKPSCASPSVPTGSPAQDLELGEQLKHPTSTMSVSTNVSSRVTSDNSTADGPCGSEGSDILALKDTKVVELTAKSNSVDVSLKATASITPEKTEKTVNSSPNELPDVNKVDVVSQGQVLSTAKFTAGSTPLSVGGSTPVSIPPFKAEFHVDNPQPITSSSEAQPTTPRTGRRQSQKPQNAVEPVKRRGRKRGVSPAAQVQNLQEPLKTTGSAAETGSSGLRPSPVLPGAARIDICTETTPRRRGRKKSAASPGSVGDSAGQYSFARQLDGKDADVAEGKIIATRSRQVNVFHPQGSLDDTRSADSTCKPLETRHTTKVEDVKQLARPAEYPPISSKGKTNVIVLALDATFLDLDPIGLGDRNIQEKKTIPKLQIGSTPSASTLKPERPRLNLTHATDIEVAKLDEELAAPPGFETSRTCLFSAPVTKSGEHNDSGISSSPNAKMGSLVLALKSASQTNVPTFGGPTVSEKDGTSEAHLFKESRQKTGVPSLSDGSSTILKATTGKVVSCHPEEDMLVPPGFDTPQKRQESVPASSLACDDGQTSDKVAESAVAKDCQGPVGGDIGHDNTDAPLIALDSDKAAAEAEKEKDVCGPSNTEQQLVDSSTTSATDPSNAAPRTSELKEQESHETDSGDIGRVTIDPSPACGVKPDTAAALTSIQGSHNEGTPALRSREHEASQCTDHGNFGHDASDAPLAVCSTDSDTLAALPSELNKNDKLGRGNTDETMVDASSASVAHLDNAATAAIGSEVHGEAHCPGNSEQKALDLTMVPVADPGTASVSELEMKGQEELPGSGKGDHGHDTSDDPLATDVVDSDTSVALTLKLNGKEPVDNEQNILDASAASVHVPDPYSTDASASELKEHEAHGPDSGDIEKPISDAPLTVSVGDSNTAIAHSSDVIEKKDTAMKDDDIGHGTSDVPLAVGVPHSATAATLISELFEKGPDKNDQNVVDASVASASVCYSEGASALESKEQPSTHGLACGNPVPDTSYDPLAVSVVDSDAAATVSVELKGPGYTEQTVADTSTAPIDVSSASISEPCNATPSRLKSEQQGDPSGMKGEHLGPGYTEENVAAISTVAVNVSTLTADDPCNATPSLKLEEQVESIGAGYREQDGVVDTSTVPIEDPCSTKSSSVKSKEQEESLGPVNTEQNVVDTVTASVDEPCDATLSSMKSKDQEESLGTKEGELLGAGYTEQNMVDTSTVPGDGSTATLDDPCNITPPSWNSNEQEESLEPGCTEQDIVDTSTVPGNSTPSFLESKEQEESLGVGHTEQKLVDSSIAPADVSTACGDDLCQATPLQSNKQEESSGPGLTEQNQIDISSASVDVSAASVDDSCNAADCTLKSKEPEESPVGSNTSVTPMLKLNEKHYPGPDNSVPDEVNASTVSGASPSDAADPVLESEEQESHGPGNTECNVIDATSASVAGPYNAADSAFESKEQEELQGPKDGSADLATTSMATDSDSSKVSASALKVEEGFQDCSAQCDAAGSPSLVMAGNVTSSTLNPEPLEEELICGPGSDLAVNVTVSAVDLKEEENDDLTEKAAVSAMEVDEEEKADPTENATVSAMELDEEENVDLSENDTVSAMKTKGEGKIDLTKNDAVSAMEVKEEEKADPTENATVSAMELDEEEKVDLSENDTVSAMKSKDEGKIDLTKNDAVSAMEVKEEEKIDGSNDGKTEDEVGDNHTAHVVDSDTKAETASESKGKTEDEVGDDRTTRHVDSDCKTEDEVGDNHTTYVVDSDTIVETAFESKGKTEDKVGDDRTTSHVDSDGKTENAVGDIHTSLVVDSDIVAATTSESKRISEDEAGDNNITSYMDSDDKAENTVGDDRTSLVDSDIVVETTPESKGLTEDEVGDTNNTTSDVGSDGKTENTVGDNSTSLVNSDTLVEMTSESKEITEDEVGDNRTTAQEDPDGKRVDDDIHTSLVDSETVVETTSESKRKGEGEDEIGDNHTTANADSDLNRENAVDDGIHTSLVDSETVVGTTSESKGKGEGEDEIGDNHTTANADSDLNRENAVDDGIHTSMVDSETVVGMTSESKGKGETEDQIGDNRTTAHADSDGKRENAVDDINTSMVDSETVVETTSESKGKGEDEDEIGDNHTTANAESDVKGENAVDDINTSMVDSETVVETTSKSKGKEEAEDEIDDSHTTHVDSDGKTEGAVAENDPSDVVDSGTVVETTAEAKEKTEDEVGDIQTTSHVTSDYKTTEDAVDGNHTHKDVDSVVETTPDLEGKSDSLGQ